MTDYLTLCTAKHTISNRKIDLAMQKTDYYLKQCCPTLLTQRVTVQIILEAAVSVRRLN